VASCIRLLFAKKPNTMESPHEALSARFETLRLTKEQPQRAAHVQDVCESF
jgi:hypothetical protein